MSKSNPTYLYGNSHFHNFVRIPQILYDDPSKMSNFKKRFARRNQTLLLDPKIKICKYLLDDVFSSMFEISRIFRTLHFLPISQFYSFRNFPKIRNASRSHCWMFTGIWGTNKCSSIPRYCLTLGQSVQRKRRQEDDLQG